MLTKNMLSGKPLQGTEIIIYVTNNTARISTMVLVYIDVS